MPLLFQKDNISLSFSPRRRRPGINNRRLCNRKQPELGFPAFKGIADERHRERGNYADPTDDEEVVRYVKAVAQKESS